MNLKFFTLDFKQRTKNVQTQKKKKEPPQKKKERNPEERKKEEEDPHQRRRPTAHKSSLHQAHPDRQSMVQFMNSITEQTI